MAAGFFGDLSGQHRVSVVPLGIGIVVMLASVLSIARLVRRGRGGLPTQR